MKFPIFSLCLLAAIMVSCSVSDIVIDDAVVPSERVFYARMEDPASEVQTRVFVDDDLMVLWNADDRVSIFNKYTFNQEYRFTGSTGANSGSFTKLPNEDFITGNAMDYVYAVYPYRESTIISNQGIITIDFPAIQHYAGNTFGLGANTMFSCSEGNELMFKNAGGYLKLSLYGSGVSISTITLKGNNGEKLAGRAAVTMPIDGNPSVTLSDDATKEITLTCENPITLGTSEGESTVFWFVIPPVTFSKGFTISITDKNGGVFQKSTSKSLSIERNMLSKMLPIEVEKITPSWAIHFADNKVKEKLLAAFDYNGDGEISYEEAASVTSGDDLKNAFGAIKTYKSFDEFQYFTGITKVPNGLFENCNTLSRVTLPSSIEYIGAYAFSGCTNLLAINLPNSIETIGNYAFNECSSLTEVSLPTALKSLGSYAFNNCTNIEGTLVIPEGVSSLNRYTFYNCSKVVGFVFTGNIWEIYDYCFSGCNSLSTITLPDGISYIGVACFYNCQNLKSIIIPSSLTGFGASAFRNCPQLSSIIIPSGIRTISKYAFADCELLESVDIPGTVSRIEEGAFYNCYSLQSVVLPDSVVDIGGSSEEAEWWGRNGVGAFENCSKLESLVIPESLSVINMSAFRGCSGLISVTIPESITKISTSAFRDCSSIKQISIPESVTTIEDFAFAGCSGLKSVFIPKTVSSLGGCVFYGCQGLTSAVVEEGRTVLPGGTFYSCMSLTDVVLPESLTEIGTQYYPQLGYYGCFAGCSSLSAISLPNEITRLGYNAFAGCSSLKSIVLPSSLTVICQDAFRGCSRFESITIPQSIEEIGAYSLYNCTGLLCVYVLSEEVPLLYSWSLDKTNNCPIYVPAGSLEAYRTTGVWANYSSRIFPITN